MAQHLDKEHGVSPTTEQPTARRALSFPIARRGDPGLVARPRPVLARRRAPRHVGAAAAGMAVPAPASAANWAPVHPGDFPDPSILPLTKATYYAFATQSFAPEGGADVNIQVSTSTDGTSLERSSARTPCHNSDRGPCRATPGRPAWRSTAALFVMYYTATEASNPGDQCIGVATSSSPARPLHRHQHDTRGVPGRGLLRLHLRQRQLRRQHRPGHLHRTPPPVTTG